MHGCMEPKSYYFLGSSEAGSHIYSHDWSLSRLGPPEHWPQSLRTTLGLLLASKFPMFVLWGPERIFLYNDTYIPILGDKHPGALGRNFLDVWPEVAGGIGPIIDKAFAGQTSFFQDLPVALERNGYPEQTYFTFSYSPVHDETGSVAGVFCTCTETTDKIVGERLQAFRLDLETRLRDLSDPLEITGAAEEALGRYLGVNRVGYGTVDASERYFTTESNWTDGMVAPSIGTHDLTNFGEGILNAIRVGQTLAVDDVAMDPRTNTPDQLAAFSFIETASAITVSLRKKGRLVAVLYVHNRVSRRWTEGEIRLVEDVAERTWSALERARAEKALRDSEDLHRHFVELSRQMAWVADPNGNITSISPRWYELTGLDSDQALGINWARAVHPDDVGQMESAIRRSVATRKPFDSEHRLRLAGGDYIWMRSRSYPLLNEQGDIVRFYGTTEDISDRKRFEERQQLLIHELNHRVKNTLATVQSLAYQTLRNATSPKQALGDLEARLIALSKAHDVLTRENWEGANLFEIIALAVEPYSSRGEDRLKLQGVDVRLSPAMALALAMALQELATNAVKYGALSNENGQVHIDWSLDPASGPPRLHLRWAEQGGPPVAPPTRRGFGSRLIERSLAADIGGEVRIRFDPSGVVCTVDAPLHMP
jgi:PAS domain S-box-containing protein